MGKNVLIVDDSASMRKSIVRSIRGAGIAQAEFEEAGDGAAGMRALETTRFDLILSDFDMPVMNGLDFVQAASRRPGTPTPIVMITGEGSEEFVAEAMTRGAKGCLKRPFTPEQIQEVLGPFLQ